MNKAPPPEPTPEKRVADALNEQGFLFSQVIREEIRSGCPGSGEPQKKWRVVTQEYAVTATDDSQTRIDLVLRHHEHSGNFLCIECKRANPLYKQWIFFDPCNDGGGTAQPSFYFEWFSVTQRPITSKSQALHGMLRQTFSELPCPQFCYWLEVAMNLKKVWSYTETIEEAFDQVARGQTGFMAKQLTFEGPFRVVAIPVVVTTAELFEARFDVRNVSLDMGMIKSTDLELHPLEFCAVNYHANDSLAVRSEFTPPCTTLDNDILYWQTRTVFVVQSKAIVSFLDWLDARIVRP